MIFFGFFWWAIVGSKIAVKACCIKGYKFFLAAYTARCTDKSGVLGRTWLIPIHYISHFVKNLSSTFNKTSNHTY